MTDPTVEQIHTYLHATGWDQRDSGAAGTLWILNRPGHHANGRSLAVPHDADAGYPPSEVIKRIAAAEHRSVVEVRDDILDVDNPKHARMRAFVVSSMCERAADVVRRQIDEAHDDGWPGVRDVWLADAMDEQAAALVETLKKTAVAIKAATEVDPPALWHSLWTAAGRAAEAILQAEPSAPDDMDAIRARLNAMRAAKTVATGDAAEDGGNCGG